MEGLKSIVRELKKKLNLFFKLYIYIYILISLSFSLNFGIPNNTLTRSSKVSIIVTFSLNMVDVNPVEIRASSNRMVTCKTILESSGKIT